MHFSERARAKINLTLRVLGRRADGYHALESIVSFADVADDVSLDLDTPEGLAIDGPFAIALEGENLLSRVLSRFRALDPGVRTGGVRLHKVLPVAAGIGGGSADAAALLRALRRANPDAKIDWMTLAAEIGADVPVCLADRPKLMWGKGEGLADLPALAAQPPAIAAVLVNPRQPLSTRDVFTRLAARPIPGDVVPPDLAALSFHDVAGLVHHLASVGNDLEAPALALLPAIGVMQAALRAQAGCLRAAMSGSGPTCFGLFATQDAAERAAAALQSAETSWWVCPTRIDFPAG